MSPPAGVVVVVAREVVFATRDVVICRRARVYFGWQRRAETVVLPPGKSKPTEVKRRRASLGRGAVVLLGQSSWTRRVWLMYEEETLLVSAGEGSFQERPACQTQKGESWSKSEGAMMPARENSLLLRRVG